MKKQKGRPRPPRPKVRKKATAPRLPKAMAGRMPRVTQGSGDPRAMVAQARDAAGRGDWRQAVALSRAALVLAPDDAEVLNVAGVAAFHSGDPDEARSLFDTALAHDPGHTEARSNLGNVLAATGNRAEAEAAYRAVVARDPAHLNGRFNLGMLLEVSGRFAEAEDQFRAILERHPDHAEARFHVGNILKALNRLPEAAAAYDAVLKAEPRHTGAQINRGAVLQESGRRLEALEAYRRVLRQEPANLDARYNLAALLQETGRPADALAEYKTVLARRPDHAGAQVNLAYALRELGRLDDALAAARKACDLAPDYDKARVNLGDLLLQMGRPEEALAVARDFLAAHPGNPSMLAFLAIALTETGGGAELDALMDFPRLLRPVEISAPPGFASVKAFNQALAAHVRAHPSLVQAPASHATRNGRHSGELLVEPKGPVAALEHAIMQAVEGYRAANPVDPAHPYLAQRPEALRLSAWGVVMEDRGHQVAHIHPAAWLSGVYYPEIPDAVKDVDTSHQGWIAFGRPPKDFHATKEPRTTLIRPQEGLMLLFPSYLYHETVPFQAPVERMSVAFDVMAGD